MTQRRRRELWLLSPGGRRSASSTQSSGEFGARSRTSVCVSTLLPAADVYETVDEFVVELEVPGYEEK